MKTDSLMMLSLPNSGSTWFASVIARHLPNCKYYDKEFFNPVCNLQHEMVLRRNFGSELVSCFANIASPGDENIDADIENTWGRTDYTFTKECQSAFKLPVFLRHFKCFAFLRSEEQSFPPSRVRVWSFYEHAWFALLAAGFTLKAETLQERAREAYRVLTAQIRADADRLNVPILEYQELFGTEGEVKASLGRALGREVPWSMVTEIVASRQMQERAARLPA